MIAKILKKVKIIGIWDLEFKKEKSRNGTFLKPPLISRANKGFG